jgi:predicted phage-related endonuclease
VSLTAAQQAIRATGLTATDMVVLSGESLYGQTEHDVYAAKVLGQPEWEDTEATSIGSELEPIVLRRLSEKIGLHVLPRDPATMTIRHARVAHHVATPDAWLAPTRLHDASAIAQAKVVGLPMARMWGDDETIESLPVAVVVQCAWEIHVSGHDVEHVGAMLGTQVRPYVIRRTDVEELIQALVETADRFWTDHVLAKVPPALDGSAGARRMLDQMYPRNRGTILKATPEAERWAAIYMKARTLETVHGSDKALAGQMLRQMIGDADGLQGDGWTATARWREPVTVEAYEKVGYRALDVRRK